MNGTNGSGLSEELHFMLGQYLAQIHQTEIEPPLTESTLCHSNTAKIYDHLTMSTATWVLRCIGQDGNPPPGSYLDKVLTQVFGFKVQCIKISFMDKFFLPYLESEPDFLTINPS